MLVHDADPVPVVGQRVFYRSPGMPARAADVGNVDDPSTGEADLVVLCQGNSATTRETWACGYSVVTFRGRIHHVSNARRRVNESLWWSHDPRDCDGRAP